MARHFSIFSVLTSSTVLLASCAVDPSGLSEQDGAVNDAAPEDARPRDGMLDAPDVGPPVDSGPMDSGPVDSGVDAGIDAPDCEEDETRCIGNTFERCDAGAFVTVESCGLGCLPAIGCRIFDPSNVDSALFLPPDGSTQTLDAPTWDTTGCTSLPHAPLEMGDYCVVRFAGDLTLTGDLIVRGTRPLIALVSGAFTLTGAVDASGDGTTGGPGGGLGQTTTVAATGSAPGGPGGTSGGFEDGGGGGGGSACGDGGRGGDGDDASGGAAGEGPRGTGRHQLEPLVGGSGGGAGARFGAGGGGGGAIQISALGPLIVRGAVEAAGAGGDAGDDDLPLNEGGYGGGGGGGGGGGVILESATSVDVDAPLLAGGGGGGGAPGCWRGSGSVNPGVTTPGGRGTSYPNAGQRPGSCDMGHTNYGANGGNGGDGSDGRTNGEDGASTMQNEGNGGGGGAAAGCIVLRSPSTMRAGAVLGVLELAEIE